MILLISVAMDDVVAGFQCDDGNWPKCAIHGLVRDEIEFVLSNRPFIAPDPSLKAQRYDAVGRTRDGRYAFVVFALRPSRLGTLIRPISARYKKEIDNHERQKRAQALPIFATDDEAEDFVTTADLTEYDFSQFKPVRFEFKPKTATVGMRMPQALLDAVKARAGHEGIPYQRFIRRTLEQALAVEPGKKSA